MGRIDRLEVDNFKSYKGFQTIGPFRDFTAVVGPNGSGKSNLMDAISFVVGVQTKHLRGEQLFDLVYNADGKRDEIKREASVTLVYIPAPGEVKGIAENEELMFQRIVTSKGSSRYKLQNHTVSKVDFDSKMREIGVIVKARNFLVFQGDVESIASKTPKQLTSFFEEISGSGDLSDEYNELSNQKNQAETETLFTHRQKKGIAQEKKEAKEQKEEVDRFNQLKEELDEMRTQYFLFQLFQIEEDLKTGDAEIKTLEDQLVDIKVNENTAGNYVADKHKDMAIKSKKVLTAEINLKKKKNVATSLDESIVKSTEEVKQLRSRSDNAERDFRVAQETFERNESDKSKMAVDLEKLVNAEKDLAAKLVTLEQNAPLTQEQLETLRSVREKASSDTVKLKMQLNSHKQMFDTSNQELDACVGNIRNLSQERDELKTQQDLQQNRQTQLSSSIATCSKQVSDCEADIKISKETLANLKAKGIKLDHDIREVNKRMNLATGARIETKRLVLKSKTLNDLREKFPGVKGRLVDLCKPSSRKYELAITVALGRHMEAIVVDKQASGFDCVKHLREKKLESETFLPLDTIEGNRVQERHRKLGDKFKLAVDLLEFDAGLASVINYALGGVVICDTLEDARILCFTRKERVKAVTLDGSVIAANGDMTGGSTAHSNKSRFEQVRFYFALIY